ncbi:MAG: UDP-N-acetylglucosamine 1-carboxyvinyltransferase [Candidatus Hydrogenedentota bacterium]
MDKFVITGGRKLEGEAEISGSKNATLPLIAATLLSRDRFLLKNVPDLKDILTMTAVLRTLGALCEIDTSKKILEINTSKIKRYEAHYDLVRKMRASVVVLGPLLARYGRAKVSLPGGCAIGTRPIDIHLAGLQRLGADISVNQGYIEALAPRGLKGAEIVLKFPSVGATQNIMMAATLACGKTVIKNAAKEPENKTLAEFLNKMGAKIEGAGTHIIMIEGVDELKGVDFDIPPDRIETGTFLMAGAITAGKVSVRPAIPAENKALLEKLREMGYEFAQGKDFITILPEKPAKPTNVKTAVYPGFPTDLQAQFMVLCCLCKGKSVMTETIFENRFMHTSELKRLGADIKVEGNKAIINGGKRLIGAPVMASDLRASAALILAGLVAKGRTEVMRVYHIDRGYERFEEKLSKLGASVKRIQR